MEVRWSRLHQIHQVVYLSPTVPVRMAHVLIFFVQHVLTSLSCVAFGTVQEEPKDENDGDPALQFLNHANAKYSVPGAGQESMKCRHSLGYVFPHRRLHEDLWWSSEQVPTRAHFQKCPPSWQV